MSAYIFSLMDFHTVQPEGEQDKAISAVHIGVSAPSVSVMCVAGYVYMYICSV